MVCPAAGRNESRSEEGGDGDGEPEELGVEDAGVGEGGSVGKTPVLAGEEEHEEDAAEEGRGGVPGGERPAALLHEVGRSRADFTDSVVLAAVPEVRS